MHYVYLLKVNHPQKQYYFGSTSNLKGRLTSHISGHVQSTKGKLPVKLIYYECYNNRELALEREINLKKSGSCYMALMRRLKIK